MYEPKLDGFRGMLYIDDGRAWFRSKTLTQRRRRLERVLAGQMVISVVASVPDARLFEAAIRLDVEGIVAKRTSDPYDETALWVKVKHAEYSQKEGRWELFRESVG